MDIPNFLQIFVSNTDLRDPEKAYNKMTVGNLSSLWPNVSVLQILSVFLLINSQCAMVTLCVPVCLSDSRHGKHAYVLK